MSWPDYHDDYMGLYIWEAFLDIYYNETHTIKKF